MNLLLVQERVSQPETRNLQCSRLPFSVSRYGRRLELLERGLLTHLLRRLSCREVFVVAIRVFELYPVIIVCPGLSSRYLGLFL